MDKEILEEAAKEYADKISNTNGTAHFDFIQGAKWQQEINQETINKLTSFIEFYAGNSVLKPGLEMSEWQQELGQKVGHIVQVERMYSAEDMRKAYDQGIDDSFDIGFSNKDNANFNKWFEQFKKK